MCIFCRIADHELPASIVYEDEHTMAFLDIQPINPGHVLIIPKTHAESLSDLTEEDAGRIMRVGQIISQALRASDLPCEGVNIFLADGKAAGQEVDHVHLHVFPRFEGDGFRLRIDQTNRKPPGRKQLDENANEIKKALEKINKSYP
jgi:histidine triad (HIT) family protein